MLTWGQDGPSQNIHVFIAKQASEELVLAKRAAIFFDVVQIAGRRGQL